MSNPAEAEAMWAELRARKDREAIRFIHETVTTRGFPPTRRELMDKLGYGSKSTAQKVLDRLIEQGLVEVEPLTPRGIKITKTGMQAVTETL